MPPTQFNILSSTRNTYIRFAFMKELLTGFDGQVHAATMRACKSGRASFKEVLNTCTH